MSFGLIALIAIIVGIIGQLTDHYNVASLAGAVFALALLLGTCSA